MKPGAAMAPVHHRLDHDPMQPWRVGADWAVAQRLDHPDAEAANRLALLDLQGGADALTVVAASSPWSRGYGLGTPDALARALDGVELDLNSLRLDAGAACSAFARALAELVDARRLRAAALSIDCGFDPIALEARTGRAPESGEAAALVTFAADAGLAGPALAADGRVWHEAGADEPRELGLVLATAVAHLRALDSAGLSLDAARRAIAIVLPFDADLFAGLAKARAMRRLWARLEAVCGLEPKPLRLHGETSWRMMTRHDPWTNAMRTTAAAFAAGLGGVDTLCVLPMTLVRGLPDAAARRLARNTSRVLLDESGLAAVDDPAAGSGTLEGLTNALCQDAWSVFQSIERGGGIAAALRDGSLRQTLAADAGRRRADVASLARGIVGTSLYPSLDVPMSSVLEVSARPTSAEGDATAPSHRDSELFETLRDRAEAAAVRPQVALVMLGEPAAFGPRATLATHLFAAAGIAVTRDVAATPVACLCGDDVAYATKGSTAFSDLREAGSKLVLAIDGRAGDAVRLAARSEDVLQVLASTLETLGC